MADGSAGRRVKARPARSSSLPPEARPGAEQTPRNEARRTPDLIRGKAGWSAERRRVLCFRERERKRRLRLSALRSLGLCVPREEGLSPRGGDGYGVPGAGQEHGRWRAPPPHPEERRAATRLEGWRRRGLMVRDGPAVLLTMRREARLFDNFIGRNETSQFSRSSPRTRGPRLGKELDSRLRGNERSLPQRKANPLVPPCRQIASPPQ